MSLDLSLSLGLKSSAPAAGGGGGSPAITFIQDGTGGGFSSEKTISLTSAVDAGDYLVFVHWDGTTTLNAATLDGNACSSLQSVAQNNTRCHVYQVTGIAGGGTQNLVLTFSGVEQGYGWSIVKVDTGTIDATAITDTELGNPCDLDLTFTNSADEILIMIWNNSAQGQFSSYDGGLVDLHTQHSVSSGSYSAGTASVTCSGGSPDTVGVNFNAAYNATSAVGVRIS